MGEMRRAIAREQEERRMQDRFASTVTIAAAIIAAVRLHQHAVTARHRSDRGQRASGANDFASSGWELTH